MFCMIIGHSYEYEVQTTTQIFFPNQKFHRLQEEHCRCADIPQNAMTVASIMENGSCTAIVYENGAETARSLRLLKADTDPERKKLVKQTIFFALQSITGLQPPWGMLTGIRPSKLVHESWTKGLTDDEIRESFRRDFGLRDDKIELCLQVAHAEKEMLAHNDESAFSLYIGIPFCPTTCLYCSFTSYDAQKNIQKTDAYLDALEKEMRAINRLTEKKRLESVYIGGGTPTSLSERQLDRLLRMTNEYFPVNTAKEFTVEAGRPDTFTENKLRLMSQYGVTRISINPQTTHDKTLERIGRRHTAAQFFDAFALARRMGFSHINVDLIMGLPGETVSDAQRTLTHITGMKPESVTVHTLSVKRASRLKEKLDEYDLAQAKTVEDMLMSASGMLSAADLKPYYMYRQKNMLGNFENVGYCRDGCICAYNVQIMGERQDIWAAGAGASTKLVDLQCGAVERIISVKNLDEYINRIDEMIERKNKGVQKWPYKYQEEPATFTETR